MFYNPKTVLQCLFKNSLKLISKIFLKNILEVSVVFPDGIVVLGRQQTY
jgi:hypothetical protein